jgi:pimeloyl-ACP methyl ester carboxylesterase
MLQFAMAGKALSCTLASFASLQFFSLNVTTWYATEVRDYTYISITRNFTGLNFCNVTVTYMHPGWNDKINIGLYLPLETWNGRFLGVGGGSFSTGSPATFTPPVIQGFAAGSTDGGHPSDSPVADAWALTSPGNVNSYLLQDFTFVALHDLAVIGKAVTKAFYGKAPTHSYWYGCSTGGRQGLMMAQRYPKDYNGIVALAPAINWHKFIVAEFWPQLIMNQLKVSPRPCEFAAITAAAVSACDGLDGVYDGIISQSDLCHFDPHTLVGKNFSCGGSPATFSKAAASIVEATWLGAHTSSGEFLWYGLKKDASLTVLAGTTCTTTGSCTQRPFPTPPSWIRGFVEKRLDYNVFNMTHEEYDTIFHDSIDQYESLIGTANPDLSAFRRAGGKMVTWHGLADELVFPDGTRNYYDRVLKLDPKAADFYRFFEAPGVAHCGGGIGPQPDEALLTVLDWVENGLAPDMLNATGMNINGTMTTRMLCQYPLVSKFVSGDPTKPLSYRCE